MLIGERIAVLRANARGVTLIELMVAMMLLTVALLGLAAGFPYAMQAVVAGGYQTTATLVAQQAIDNARFTLYGNLSTLTSVGGTGTCGGGTGTFVALAGYDGFKRCIDVQTGSPTSQTTTVTVVVRFVGIGGFGVGTIYDTTVSTIIAQ
jgi:prepilin-type N-terminal cleavage/methylation domain-containing protein